MWELFKMMPLGFKIVYVMYLLGGLAVGCVAIHFIIKYW